MGIYSDILLTVDFDRTLTGPDSTIPERNLEAIRYFTENGGSFTLNTGRSTTTLAAYLNTIPVNAPFLLYNGSAAYDRGTLLNTKTIDLPQWETIQQIADLFPDMHVEVQGERDHYLFRPDASFMAFYKALGWHYAILEADTQTGPFLKFSLWGTVHKNAVSDMFSGTEEELQRFAEAEATIRRMFPDKVEVFRAAPRIIDVHAKGVSKLAAARDLQKRLGKKILVCVGDAENDITMLDGADYAYCPADGVVADRYENVCNCGDGAVADVIYEKIPEILRIQP